MRKKINEESKLNTVHTECMRVVILINNFRTFEYIDAKTDATINAAVVRINVSY